MASWRTSTAAGPRTVAAGPDLAAWNPTVLNLTVLIVIEIGAYLALRYAFRTTHGG
jgi:hypothetical protein